MPLSSEGRGRLSRGLSQPLFVTLILPSPLSQYIPFGGKISQLPMVSRHMWFSPSKILTSHAFGVPRMHENRCLIYCKN